MSIRVSVGGFGTARLVGARPEHRRHREQELAAGVEEVLDTLRASRLDGGDGQADRARPHRADLKRGSVRFRLGPVDPVPAPLAVSVMVSSFRPDGLPPEQDLEMVAREVRSRTTSA